MEEEIKEIEKDASMQEYTMNTSTDNADYSVVYIVKNDLLVQVIAKIKINGIDLALSEQMKVQFENGVRLWHDNGTKNPMSQNILENKIIK